MKFDIKFTSHIDTDRPNKILRALWRGVDFGANRIEKRAKHFVPVDTGKLQKSIETKDIKGGKGIGPDTDYDIYVEFGTSKMAAQPYMRPALIEQRKPITDFVTREIRKVLK